MNKLLICVYLVLINYAFICNGQRPFYLGTGQKPTCVNQGDYCRGHVDCCSQNCSNSTSRCVAAVRINVDSNLSQQQNNNTNTTNVSTLQNRFNEASSSSNCLGISAFCKVGRDCCSKTCFKSQCVSIDKRQNVQCSGVNQKCSSSPGGCCDFLSCENNVCRDRAVFVEGTETFGYNETEAGIINRFSGDENQSTVAPVPVPCKEIGGQV